MQYDRGSVASSQLGASVSSSAAATLITQRSIVMRSGTVFAAIELLRKQKQSSVELVDRSGMSGTSRTNVCPGSGSLHQRHFILPERDVFIKFSYLLRILPPDGTESPGVSGVIICCRAHHRSPAGDDCSATSGFTFGRRHFTVRDDCRIRGENERRVRQQRSFIHNECNSLYLYKCVLREACDGISSASMD